MSGSALCAQLEQLVEAADRVSGLLCRVLGAVEATEATVGEYGRAPRATLVEECRRSPGEAGTLLFVTRRLPAHPAVGAALDAGDISLAHARAVLSCLTDLPPQWATDGERILLEAARGMDPVTLGRVAEELRARAGAGQDAAERAEAKYASRWAKASTRVIRVAPVHPLCP